VWRYVPPLVRHASAGSGIRYSDRAGIARASRREDHHDLYPCPESWRESRSQPTRL